jgi:hypothetical protein
MKGGSQKLTLIICGFTLPVPNFCTLKMAINTTTVNKIATSVWPPPKQINNTISIFISFSFAPD